MVAPGLRKDQPQHNRKYPRRTAKALRVQPKPERAIHVLGRLHDLACEKSDGGGPSPRALSMQAAVNALARPRQRRCG